MTGGAIAFDYGLDTVRFGIDISEAEAGMLVGLLTDEIGRKRIEPAM